MYQMVGHIVCCRQTCLGCQNTERRDPRLLETLNKFSRDYSRIFNVLVVSVSIHLFYHLPTGEMSTL